MTVRAVLLLASIFLVISPLTVLLAAELHVDVSVTESGDGTSWENAFKTIQEGINAALDGDTVVIAEGIYVENIEFKGKNIVLTSTDPLDTDVVAHTIIDGNQTGSVVVFVGTEDETCVLEGFTVRNGVAAYDQGLYGGGICGGMQDFENLTRATIQNNVITHNDAYRGGGIGLCNGTIRNNTISQNSAGRGGGLRLCHGIIENNVITGNTSSGEGAAGIDNCNAIIQNNIISANSGTDSDGEGGLGGCDGIIQNNLISGNSSRGGAAGLSGCDGPILNNTVVGNSTTGDESLAGGLGGCGGIIRNCIIWGNTLEGEGAQLSNCTEPAYCCIQDWTGGGVDNTDRDPLFIDARGGDYRRQSESPCIDTGVNYYWCAWPQRDLDGNCRLAGETVDMGCYEHNSPPDSDGDLLSDADEPAAGTDSADDDTDGDGLRDGLELIRGTDPLTPTPPRIVHVTADQPTIQIALCLAVKGDQIVVDIGTYLENLLFCGLDVTLRSSDPKDPKKVAVTTLDGDGIGPVVSFTGRESEDCVLSGFTIRNGNAGSGGGIYGGVEGNSTHATIQNSTITENSARRGGGGLAFCDGVIQNNTISGNSAPWRGGGLHGCNGIVQGNIISGNSSGSGGGLHACYGTIRNNTITGNAAGRDGGGLSWCQGTIANCIIWGNTAEDMPQLDYCVEPSHSCIQGYTGGGKGNSDQDPLFVDANGADDDPETYDDNDYHLSAASPCIDEGDNSVLDLPGFDLDGNLRIALGRDSLTVDMGAYEHNSQPFAVKEIMLPGGGAGLRIIWNSQPNDSYVIWWSTDVLAGPWNQHTTVESQGESTNWIDPDTTPTRKFYRIEIR